MKAKNQIELTASVVARRNLTTRIAVASLVLATATIPAIAGNGPTSKEDRAAIRPFHINVPKAELTELRKRIQATKWPTRELVTDVSGRATRYDAEARPLLGNRLRLAQDRSATKPLGKPAGPCLLGRHRLKLRITNTGEGRKDECKCK